MRWYSVIYKQIKSIYLSLFILLSLSCFGQKIGLVSDINPTMGYAHMTGVVSPKPVYQESMRYNFFDFIKSNLKTKDLEIELYRGFNFENLAYLNPHSPTKKISKYVRDYCESNNIEKLIIVNRRNLYTTIETMRMFHQLDYDYGIVTTNYSKKGAMFYLNFYVSIYDFKNNKFHKSYGSKIFSKTMSEATYDPEKLTLTNNNLYGFFVEKLETQLKSYMHQNF